MPEGCELMFGVEARKSREQRMREAGQVGRMSITLYPNGEMSIDDNSARYSSDALLAMLEACGLKVKIETNSPCG